MTIKTITSMAKGTAPMADAIMRALMPPGAEKMTLVDIGCGAGARTRFLPCKKTFVDHIRPADWPEPFIQQDLMRFLNEVQTGEENQFDILTCMDVIEHFEKTDGWNLLNLAGVAAPRLIFFTPLGEMHLSNEPGGHRSGWMPEEFEGLGYDTMVFPRFHCPWYDGKTWGAFFAVRGLDVESAFNVIEGLPNE